MSLLPIPGLQLAFELTKYIPIAKHIADGNIDSLTKDLGASLRHQKNIIQDPDMNSIETATEIGPVIAEVKLLTMVVSKKLGIDTKGKSTIAVLEEIVQLTEARNSNAAKEVKNTLGWTREFFSKPEIQAILSAEMISIEKPHDIKGITTLLMQTGKRISQEAGRAQDFLKEAKKIPEQTTETDAKATPEAVKQEPETKPAPKKRTRKNDGPQA